MVVTMLATVGGSAPRSSVVRMGGGAYSQLAEASAALTSGGYKPGQVAFWTGSNTIAGDSQLFWDRTNRRLLLNDNSSNNFVQISSDDTLGINAYKGTSFGGKVSIGGNGETWDTYQQTLTVYGGLRLVNSRIKPSCSNSGYRGTLWFTPGGNTGGGSTIPDKLEVCAADSTGKTGWRKLY